MLYKTARSFALLFILIFSLFSCKSIDENKIYTQITPELIEIISKYKADKSKSPVYSSKPVDYSKESILMLEFDPANPPEIDRIVNLNFTVIVLSMKFEHTSQTVLDSLQKENNVMAMDREIFTFWLNNASEFTQKLVKKGIKVLLAVNLNSYRFNYRMNIPVFHSTQYHTLSSKGKDVFKEYLYKFHQLLTEKLNLSGIILQNTDFLAPSHWREYCQEMRDFGGKGFFIAFFSQGDMLLKEKLIPIGVDAVLDNTFSNRGATAFSSSGSLARFTENFSVDTLYRFPSRHILFLSTKESHVKTGTMKNAITVFNVTSPRIGITHADSDYFSADRNVISGLNAYKRRYLQSSRKIELYKDDDSYSYLLSTGYRDVLVVLNKSSRTLNTTYFLKLRGNIPENYVFKDLSGAPPVQTTGANISLTLAPENARVLFYKSKNKFRDITISYRDAVSYSQEERDIRIIKFAFRPGKPVESVNLVGDFNNWDNLSLPMIDKNRNGVYEIEVPLPPGRYTYKILLNGQTLVADHSAQVFMDDGNGGKKSVVIVR